MTAPGTEFDFPDRSGEAGVGVVDLDKTPDEAIIDPNKVAPGQPKFPDPIIPGLSDETIDRFKTWLDEEIDALKAEQSKLQDDWAGYESSYRALPEAKKSFPFEGASNDVMPIVAMAIDPVHARLDTGIFKQDPVFIFKALKKNVIGKVHALSSWVDYYQTNKLKLRDVSSPGILEMTKLGTMVLKTVYDREEYPVKTYGPNWKVETRKITTFSGPKVFNIALGDFLFPPTYQHLQDCPIIVERQRTTLGKLYIAEASGKLTNVDSIKGQENIERTAVEEARDTAIRHEPVSTRKEIVIYEIWCDYALGKEDKIPERLVATYERETRTLLQLRYNWYFHQRKPYTIIPYSISNSSLYGIGIAEMVEPFQKAITRWQQMSSDNAYIANIRMYIAKKNSGIEEVPRLYAGKVFFVDDPSKDFIPFAAGDTYNSTLEERQNLFGMVEKRTGISDYLVGRESPIIGTRATATSTLALIQEGTRRVEEVLENLRRGFSEVIENCIYIWIQYGLDGLDEVAFGDDQIGTEVREFFKDLTAENVNGAIAIDLAASDARNNRQMMQQLQLAIIQVMMTYLERMLQAGQAALQAQQQSPEFAGMIKEVMRASKVMFTDLLRTYDIRNPEEYLPALEEFLDGDGTGQGVSGSAEGQPGGFTLQPRVSTGDGTFRGPTAPVPSRPGGGGSTAVANALARASGGSPGGP